MGDQNILLLLGFLVLLVSLVSPIIKLNATITKLNVTLDSFERQTEKNHSELSQRVKQHGIELDKLKSAAVKQGEEIKHIKEGK